MKTAVIMAAGVSSRFGVITETKPKGFINMGGKPMIIHSIENLLYCGIEKIIIGTGYHSEFYEDLEKRYSQIRCCKNNRYAETNSMYTLYNCKDLIDSDIILLESDLIYEKRAIEALLQNVQENIMLGAEVKHVQEYLIEADYNGWLVNVSTDSADLNHITAEFVGIHKLSYTFLRQVCDIYDAIVSNALNQGYEFMILEASAVYPCYVLKIDELVWYEIDNETDLYIAQRDIWPLLAQRQFKNRS